MPAEATRLAVGAERVLLVLAGGPGLLEQQSYRPILGDSGQWLRRLVEKQWAGPAVYAHSVRCQGTQPTPDQLRACRGFLATTLKDAQPARILALGQDAYAALLGRSGPRRGVGWVQQPKAPVFRLHGLREAWANRFIKRELEADLEWALTCDNSVLLPPSPSQYALVEDAATAREAAEELRSGFAYDCEWFGNLYSSHFRLLSVACAPLGEDIAFVWTRDGLRRQDVQAVLRQLMEDPRVPKTGHELKADLQAITRGLGVRPGPVETDTLLWTKLTDPEGDGHLDVVAERVGMGGYKAEAEAQRDERKQLVGRMRGKEKKAAKAGQGGLFAPAIPACPWLEAGEVTAALNPDIDLDSISYGLIDPPVLYRYNARDAIATARRAGQCSREMIQQPDLCATWQEVVRAAVHAYARVEEWGMPVDKGGMEHLAVHFDGRLRLLENEMRKVAGQVFNPGSNKEVGTLLFEKFGIPATKKTATGQYCVDEEALTAVQHLHPVVPLILEDRSLRKLKGTYCDGLLGLIGYDGRIHPHVLIEGARSGRPSCASPNLQNIPRADTDDGRLIRQLFAAPRGRKLWEVDFSQLELRIACMLSGDEEMLRIFQEGVDFHEETARLVGCSRQTAKVINFSVLYGKTARGLAQALGCSEPEAVQVHRAILGRFHHLRDWIEDSVDYARQHGGCWTWWNGHNARWRPLPDVGLEGDDSYRRGRRESAERASYNTRVQGTGSDFCLASLGVFVDWIERTGSNAKVCVTVHDSMLIETDEQDDLPTRVAIGVMTSWPAKGVPIKVDAKAGPSWGALEKVKIQPAGAATI